MGETRRKSSLAWSRSEGRVRPMTELQNRGIWANSSLRSVDQAQAGDEEFENFRCQNESGRTRESRLLRAEDRATRGQGRTLVRRRRHQSNSRAPRRYKNGASFFCANLLKSEHLVRRRATRGPQVFDLFGIFGQKQRISNPCGRKFAQFANAGASQVIPKTPPTPSMAARASTTVLPLHRGCLCIVAPHDAGALAGALHGSWRCTDTGPERNDTFISRALISQVALFSNRAGAGTVAGELLHLSRRGWSPPLNRSQG